MKSSQLKIFFGSATIFITILLFFSVSYISRLNDEIKQRFDGKRWSVPAIVYARPLDLYSGRKMSPEMFAQELELGGYRKLPQVNNSGSYSRNDDYFSLVTRGFYFPSGYEPSRHLSVEFMKDELTTITDTTNQQPVDFVRIDPARIGSFHPIVHEDRIIINRQEIPELLIQTLLAVEDRNFYSHFGVSPFSILRALTANFKAGKTVQGGSTLTQQLVKNLFLTSQRSLTRKIQEAIMAILLEYHYSKDDILTAYINEVFLGQDNNRAIHGFALASQYYFRQDLTDIAPQQIATLVGMVKGPSLYNPERNPEICLSRRNSVLQIMADAAIISHDNLKKMQNQPLVEVAVQKGGFNRFPAFLDVVRHQLAGEYREEDLKSNGLQILTTLDPQFQFAAESGLQKTIVTLEKEKNLQELEGATIVTGRETGEILAVVGGRNPLLHGFNRAVSARRPIGSLVKPAVYLTALNSGYTLASPLLDETIQLNPDAATFWKPENYDKKEHGQVPLYLALANSYNLATVRLGLNLGVESVIKTIQRLGFTREIEPYPSLFLGAVSMSPLEVCQLYQTIASGGFYSSLRAINSVMAADHSLINRYGFEVEQRFSPQANFLLTHAMQRVVREGTAQSLLNSTLGSLMPAGKTGTSDNLRDSWFAGFTGDHLALVWLGRDDNKPAKLSGSSGALHVWKNIMENIPNAPLEAIEPPGLVWQRARTVDFTNANHGVQSTTMLPFIIGSEPAPQIEPLINTAPLEKKVERFFDKLNRWLQ